MHDEHSKTSDPAVGSTRLVRRLISAAIAITVTPTIVLPGFMLGVPIVSAWTGSGDAGADWAERYWEGWGAILKRIGGQAPNSPAEARRADEARTQTGSYTRRCLRPDGSASGL